MLNEKMKVIIAVLMEVSQLFIKQNAIITYDGLADVLKDLCKKKKLKIVEHSEDGSVVFNTIGEIEEIGVRKHGAKK